MNDFAVATIKSQASIAAARNMKACSLVITGPSSGTVFDALSAGGACIEGNASSAWRVSSLLAFGNSDVRPKEGVDVDRSITPRCTSREGITLSENMGRLLVRGMGIEGVSPLPKRTAMACSVSIAFLKQYTAVRHHKLKRLGIV